MKKKTSLCSFALNFLEAAKGNEICAEKSLDWQ